MGLDVAVVVVCCCCCCCCCCTATQSCISVIHQSSLSLSFAVRGGVYRPNRLQEVHDASWVGKVHVAGGGGSACLRVGRTAQEQMLYHPISHSDGILFVRVLDFPTRRDGRPS